MIRWIARPRAATICAAAVLALGLAVLSVGAQEAPIVRLVYFSSDDCTHCAAVWSDVLEPLQSEHGEGLHIKAVDVTDPQNYEVLLRAEEMFGITAGERGLPTLIVNGEVLIGEEAMREQLVCIVDTCAGKAGTAWPDIPGLEEIRAQGGSETQTAVQFSLEPPEGAMCTDAEIAACQVPSAIWAAYFYDVGCQECSRAKYDIQLVKRRYPQLVVEEYNVQGDAPLAEWLGARAGLPVDERLASPCVFIGDDVLCGTTLTAESLQGMVEEYAVGGAPKVWTDFDASQGQQSIVERFQSFGALAVAGAGLIDGLNPCAFATLVFFVSYLTLSGRRGKEVLAVGAAFTFGVFLAYLAVGFGLYRVLDLLGGLLTTLGRWVYGLTALLCAVLAILSLLDALKARRGDLSDMMLSLPHKLRMRINSVIRSGRKSPAFVSGAFVTGLVVSLLELACTGQVYLPTIVFVVSQPALRARAVGFLLLYNLLFVTPLIAVFILTYYGAGSQQLARFLERRAPAVKASMAVLFAILAVWLGMSVVAVA